LGRAAERILGGPAEGRTAARADLAGAVAAARAALDAPTPRPPDVVDRLVAAVRALGAPAEQPSPPGGAALDPRVERVVSIRALARDGDTEYVVHRAEHPGLTADRRFRVATLPLAQALRDLVAGVRSAGEGANARSAAAHTLGADLCAAIVDIRELAESYDVTPVATFFARREPGAAVLDPRTLAAVDEAAAGLLGDAARVPVAADVGSPPAGAAPPAPAPPAPLRPLR
jgi:hypothetical protein